MKATITGAVLSLPATHLPNDSFCAAQSIDLTPHQGGPVRVYLSATGSLEVNPSGGSYWQVAEAMLPPAAIETVVTGTQQDVHIEPRMIPRAAGDDDAIPLAANEWVDAVGFSWARYAAGVDYTLTATGLMWLTAHRPAADYLVDVAVATTVDVTENQLLPLDLAAHAVILFNLPA